MNTQVNVETRILHDVYRKNPLEYALPGDAAIDLRSTISAILQPGVCLKVPLGVAINIRSPNVAAMILPRSGLGTEGIVLGNTVGLIDNGYQGELIASVWNRTDKVMSISEGQKICQIMFVPFLSAVLKEVEVFQPSERGARGFGSTGG